MLAEENWRRSRLTTNYGNALVSINGQSLDKSYPQRNLRDLMEELRSSTSQNKNNPNSSQSQADYTAADLIVSSESDGNEDEDELPSNNMNNRNQDFSKNNATHQKSGHNLSTNHSAVRSQIAQRKKLPTPSPTAQVLGDSPTRHRTDSKSSLDDSVYSSLSNDLYSKINLPVDHKNQQATQISENHHSAPLNETCRNVPFSPITKNSNLQNKTPQLYKKRSQRSDDSYSVNNKSKRELLKEKLKDCSLVSESGTASVIEVIEPTLSEEEDFQNSIREMSWNISVNGSKKESTSSYLSSPKNSIPTTSFFGSNEIKTNSPITIYPTRNDERSSIITITSSNSNTARSSGSSSSSYSVKNVSVMKLGRGKRCPISEVGMDGQSNLSNTSADNYEDSSSNRYSTYSDVSPTKRLLEMGITATALNDTNVGEDFDEDEEEDHENRFFNNPNEFVKSGSTSLKIESPNGNNNAVYVIKKKKPHPTSITITGNTSINNANVNLNNNDSPVNFTNKISGGTNHSKTSITPNLNSSKITFTDLDFLQEHFVDDSFDHGDMNQLEQDGDISKMSANKKTTFLQKIASKTKWNNMKKKINTTNKENVETTTYKQNSLNGSPLISQRRAMNSIQAEEDEEEGLEEHILPDSFEDLPGDSHDSVHTPGVQKKSDVLNDEAVNDEEINEGDKPIFDIIKSRTKSLSPSSRKSFLLSTTSTINSSSTATMKSSSGVSATSVASTSEDSGIGLMASSTSSALLKAADSKISSLSTNKSNGKTNESLTLSLHNSRDPNNELFSHSTPARMKTSIELTLLNGHAHSQNERVSLSKIDEASSVASQSSKSCNSELMHDKSFGNNIEPYDGVINMNERNFIDTNILSIVKKNSSTKSPIITSNLPGTIASSIPIPGEQKKLKRNFSNTKAWYDIPSDEDPEAPEADSLASIITHRSHSSEED